LQLGGQIVKADGEGGERCGEPFQAARAAAFAERARVREWRLVSQRSAEWTGEMVVEYAVCFDHGLVRWARYNQFVELRRQVYACYPVRRSNLRKRG
jgi:hypothetical protein